MGLTPNLFTKKSLRQQWMQVPQDKQEVIMEAVLAEVSQKLKEQGQQSPSLLQFASNSPDR